MATHKRIVAGFCILVCISTNLLTAQEWTKGTRFMLYGGLNLPTANFAKQQEFSLNSLDLSGTPVTGSTTMEQTPPGNALPGFTLGYSSLMRILPNFSITGTLEFNYNTFDADRVNSAAADFIRAQDLLLKIAGINSLSLTTTSKSYINSLLLGGIRYDLPVLPDFSVFVAASAGINYGIFPENNETLKAEGVINGLKSTVELTAQRSSASAVGFAYRLGLGALISEKFHIGVAYTDCRMSYSSQLGVKNFTINGISTPLPLGSAIPETTVNSTFPTAMIQVTVGYVFALPF